MTQSTENITLYVRGMNQQSDDTDDVWDDTALNNAYDKALKTANEEVAKRIAMETNSNQTGKKSKSIKGKVKAKKESSKSNSSTVWKEGMPCRAIYEEDGLEYEAFLMNIIDDEYCVVQFIGYENSETVPLSTVKRSLGDAARMRQIDEATREANYGEYDESDGGSIVDLNQISDESSTQELHRGEIGMQKQDKGKKKKSNKKKNYAEHDFGDLPALAMPKANMFRNNVPDMPFPPPPPLVSLAGRSDAEEQAISDMLLSWYMTGYYTGLYQGMKRQRMSRRCH